MSDTLLPGLLKKLQELEKFARDDKNDRKKIVVEIIKTQNWLTGDRSILEHNCCQAFITYLWQRKSEKYKTRESFYEYIKEVTGFIKIERRKVNIQGEVVRFKKIKYRSLSFGKCSQKEHHKFFNELQEIATVKWGVDFLKWKAEWDKNQHLLI